jgi:hypothetical protein
MNIPKQKTRFRRLALMAFIGVIGIMGSLVTLIFVFNSLVSIPMGSIFASIGVFGVLGATAGYLMQREIDRRL